MQKTLTRKQIERQDFVDNAVFNLFCELAPDGMEWDIESIGEVRDAVQRCLAQKGVMTEADFYPHIDS